VSGYILSGGLWSLRVVNGEYKHKLTQLFQGHKYAKRLQLEEKKRVHEMTGIMVLPRNIFITLKNRNDRSATIIKHMYKL
jgi:hypothetical protein